MLHVHKPLPVIAVAATGRDWRSADGRLAAVAGVGVDHRTTIILWAAKQRVDVQRSKTGRWGIWRAGRKVIAVVAVLALLLAPLLNTRSHGPADYVDAVLAMAVDLAHGHSHGIDGGTHNAIDIDITRLTKLSARDMGRLNTYL